MSTPAQRLVQARKAGGFSSAREGALRTGVPYNTYIQHERGVRAFDAGKAETYARAYGVDPAWLLYGRGSAPTESAVGAGSQAISRFVPVLGVVRAGAWSDIPEEEREPEEHVPIHLPGFEQARLFALRVEGRSMDRAYPDGSIVVVCPAAEVGVREGDHVVVRRRRKGLIETTLKEVVREKDGSVALWPRSTDPAYQSPIRIEQVRDSDEGPEIIGVVVASYSVRPLQPRPLIQL